MSDFLSCILTFMACAFVFEFAFYVLEKLCDIVVIKVNFRKGKSTNVIRNNKS